MRVLHVASECYPFVKTGGLADVVGALPGALNDLGCDARILLPAYPDVLDALPGSRPIAAFPDLFGGKASILETSSDQRPCVYLLQAPHLYDRPGNPYLGPNGKDWPDNSLRFAAFSRAAAAASVSGLDGWIPDIVHAHDWQAGLIPAYLRHEETQGQMTPRTVMTIHNIAFQGLMPGADRAILGLPDSQYAPNGMEYFGQVSYLKAGLVYADRLTTVSPTYAGETRTSDYGMGMQGILAERAADYRGILNGVDETVWNPKTDPHIVARYSRAKPGGKAANKKALQREFGLPLRSRSPIFGVVSRLTEQKGLDLLLSVLPMIGDRGGQCVLLGSGEAKLESGFLAAAAARPDFVGIRVGYDEALSHQIQAGSDFILVPSRFEPCGLTQLYALRYGAIPLVSRTGGLADTVIDANDAALSAGTATGIQFTPITAPALAIALERAFEIYSDKRLLRKMRARAMAHPVSWSKSAAHYMTLYADMLGEQ